MIKMKDLHTLQEKRALVIINRKDINDIGIQGIILGYSKKLILIQYVYDFNLDGIMVLQRSGITSIESDESGLFQTQLLKDEGLYDKVDFTKKYNLKNWKSFLSHIDTSFHFITLEDEDPYKYAFMIGKVTKLGRKKVSVHQFSCTGTWKKEVSKMSYKNITSLRVGNHYPKVYENYFKQNNI
jgi:hypothetical protein